MATVIPRSNGQSSIQPSMRAIVTSARRASRVWVPVMVDAFASSTSVTEATAAGSRPPAHRPALHRCTRSDQHHRALDDGAGSVHPPFAALMAAVLAMPQSKNGLSWSRSPHVQQLLR